jgi:hypothetical protein
MKYITTADAAKIIGVSDRQVQRYCEQGLLGHKPGRNCIITDREAKEFKRPPKGPPRTATQSTSTTEMQLVVGVKDCSKNAKNFDIDWI